MHNVVEFSDLYKFIKLYGKKKTDDKLIKYSTLVKDKTKDLTLFIGTIKLDKIHNQVEFNKVNDKYISLLNEVSLAYAKYHGFIIGLTITDFNY